MLTLICRHAALESDESGSLGPMLAVGGASALLAMQRVNRTIGALAADEAMRIPDGLFFAEPDFLQPDGYDSDAEMQEAFEPNRASSEDAAETDRREKPHV